MSALRKLIEKLKLEDIANIIISDPHTIKYLINYYTDPGERLLVLLVNQQGQVKLYLNRLFPKYSKNNIEVSYYEDGQAIIPIIGQNLLEGVTSIDKFWPSQFLIELMENQPNIQFENYTEIIDNIRGIKTAEEISLMSKASALNDQAMDFLVKELAKEPSEEELADKLLKFYQDTDHTGTSFTPIVGYGDHGADPHHTTTQRKPQWGDAVVLDIGGIYQGYASDMTRTVFYGEVSDKARQVYEIVRKANEEAIAMIKPGIPFSEIDLKARSIIEAAGYGQYFTHRLGHFIGQTAHEAGDVSQYNHNLTQVGQVFSIEPGIYLPGKFGVRIEDLVVVTEESCQILNHYPKDLIVVNPDKG